MLYVCTRIFLAVCAFACVSCADFKDVSFKKEYPVSNNASVEIDATPSFKQGNVSGQVWYEYVPTVCEGTRCMLDYTKTYKKPVRGCSVLLVESREPFRVVAKSFTDTEGHYVFEGRYWVSSSVQVVVQSLLQWFPVYVKDNTDATYPVYAIASKAFVWAPDMREDLVALSGWDGEKYAHTRMAAPFAVLDVLYTGYNTVQDPKALDVLRTTPLDVFWSEKNKPVWGYVSEGNIGTTHWDLKKHTMYVLGAQNQDTDEYDAHVVAHEWAHAMESFLSRSDSMGGPHGDASALLDPRLAFSEGLADAMSALVLENPVYTDTMGVSQGYTAYFANIEQNTVPVKGWYSEGAVRSMVYDIADMQNEHPQDTLGLGMNGVFRSLLYAHKKTQAFTSVFSFVDGLKQAYPYAQEPLDTLTQWHGVSPVYSAWADFETHDGGWEGTLPVFHQAFFNQSHTLFFNTALHNPAQVSLGAHRWMYLQNDTPQRVSVKIYTEKPVSLTVYKEGQVFFKSPVVCWDMACETLLMEPFLEKGVWTFDFEAYQPYACEDCNPTFYAVVRVSV